MNTWGLHYVPRMVEVSTFDQYSLRNGHWAKCKQRASITGLPPPNLQSICSKSFGNSVNQ